MISMDSLKSAMAKKKKKTNSIESMNIKSITTKRKPATMAELIASMSSTIATIMFAWTIIRQYCPYELKRSLRIYTDKLFDFFNPYVRISIYEYVNERLNRSKAYSAVEAYLGNKLSDDAKRLKAEAGAGKNSLVLTMEENERVIDEFEGVEIWWISSKMASSSRRSYSMYSEPDRKFYRLTFHRKYRKIVTESYLKHVMKEGKEIRLRRRQRKLYTNCAGNRSSSYKQTSLWSDVFFEHPATFDTLAMDPEKKEEIIEDLLTFSESKDFYARIGKAWKRGYLLYGPPGTGKSTMIAAMANLLHYDVYDLELTAVKDNTELRKLLIETTSKSIIVIEDVDCSLDLTGKRKKKEKSTSSNEEEKDKEQLQREPPRKEEEETSSKVTLSGLLNFIDGIWSACGGERLVIFTTNHVEKLDPALIRTGRMDKHIELSYCGFEAFKVLAKNYLNLETHQLFDQIQELIKDLKITPADVAESLMPKARQDSVENSLSRLIQTLINLKRAAAMKETVETNAENLKVSLEIIKGESPN